MITHPYPMVMLYKLSILVGQIEIGYAGQQCVQPTWDTRRVFELFRGFECFAFRRRVYAHTPSGLRQPLGNQQRVLRKDNFS